MPEVSTYAPGTPSWSDVASPDLDNVVGFYEGLFGWKAGEGSEETNGYRMFTQGDKAVAGAGPTQSPEQPPAWTTYVTVADADATAEKVKAAGGSVLMEPMDVVTAGRMAIFMDPAGAAFAVWQPKDHIGSQIVNEPVSMTWNELRTRDVDGAVAFYGEVFGWEPQAFEQMDGYNVWMLGGSAPENGVGGVIDMGATEFPAEVPPHWDVVFAVEDTDATVAKATELGGTVTVPPMDIPVGRMAGIQDPSGAMFTVLKLAQQPG